MFARRVGRCLSALVTLTASISAATAEQRTWTDNTGKFSIEAEFVAISDGKLVLKAATGKTVRVPLDRLGQTDRRHAEALEGIAQGAALRANPIAADIKAAGAWVTVDRLRPGAPIVKVRFHSIHRLGAEAALQRLAQLPSLEELDFLSGSVTDAALSHLSKLKSLRKLDLSHTGITNAGLAHLAELTELRSLDLAGVAVTDVGLAHLEQLTNLESLTLGGKQITNDGLAHLSRMTKLKLLVLGGTKITDAGLVHLKQLANLREVRLYGPKITGAGLVHLRGMSKLRVLRLAWSKITEQGLVHLAGLTGLRELSVIPSSEAGLAHLEALKNLEELFLGGGPVGDEGLSHLQGLANLRTLDLGGTQVTDAGLAYLAGLHQLEWLWLDATPISGPGLHHLHGLRHLYYVSLGRTRITDEGLQYLPGIRTLKILSLAETKVTGAGFSHLQSLSNLEDLDLTGCPISVVGLTHLKELAQLDSLDLSYTGIDDVAVSGLRVALPETQITWMPTKQQLAAAGQAAQSAVAKLKSLGAALLQRGNAGWVQSIRLEGEGVTDATLAPIRDLDPRSLTSLTLRNTRLTDAGMAHLERLTNLQALDLTNAAITDDGVAQLSALERLVSLDLSGCQVTDEGVAHLHELKRIAHLSLNRTLVSDSGMTHLQELPQIRFLELRRTNVTDEGLEVLSHVKTLVALDLSGAPVTDQGIQHLGRLPGLQHLYLLNTPVTDAGLAPLDGRRHLRVRLPGQNPSDDDLERLEQLIRIEKRLDLLSILPTSAVNMEAKNRNELVLSLLRRAHALEPENPEWAEKLGSIAMTKARWLAKNNSDDAEQFRQTATTALDYFDKALKGRDDDGMLVFRLAQMARLAFDAGKYERAASYGERLLALPTDEIGPSSAARAVHQGNGILGQLALRSGDVEQAKRRLLVAGESGGWTSLGPNMALAKALLEQGEVEVVLEYFELCKKSWPGQEHQLTLQQWADEVQQGKIPDFGRHVAY